jgi:hypothetical protein
VKTSKSHCVPVILATWEVEIEGSWFEANRRQIVFKSPISKITRAKWTGGVTQAIEHLLCKHKALNSNLSPTENRYQ